MVHVHVAVFDQEIAALHQVGADLAGQEHVLVESRVVDTRGKQCHRRIRGALGREFAQGLAEDEPVVLDVSHPGTAIEEPMGGLGCLPDGKHVRHPGGHAQVVLEDAEPVVGANQVGPADRRPHAVGALKPRISRRYCGQSRTMSAGITPSAMIRASPVDIREEPVEGG